MTPFTMSTNAGRSRFAVGGIASSRGMLPRWGPCGEECNNPSSDVAGYSHRGNRRRRHHQTRSRDGGLPLPPRMTISRASRLFRAHPGAAVSCERLCEHFHNVATFGESSLGLNAYARLLPLRSVLEMARESDERLRDGVPRSSLEGVPVTVKANIAVGGWWEMPTACSSILRPPDDDVDDDENVVCNERVLAAAERSGTMGGEPTIAYESDVARRLLRECGAVLIGITNMDEFGMGSLGVNSYSGGTPTYNPLPWMHRLSSLSSRGGEGGRDDGGDDYDDDRYWLRLIESSTPDDPHGVGSEDELRDLLMEYRSDDPTSSRLYSPGGSSSGAAVSVAHGSSLLSLGTDTGGSIRLPAAWTGTVGFKPSYGTFSRHGVVAYASSLDTVGYIAGSAECARIAWECLRGDGDGVYLYDDGGACTYDAGYGRTDEWDGRLSKDATSVVYHGENWASSARPPVPLGGETEPKLPLAGMRVGVPSAFCLSELPPPVADAWSSSANRLQNVGGATLVTVPESSISPELVKLALASYYVLACAEASSNLCRYDGVRYGMDSDAAKMPWDGDEDAVVRQQFHPLADMTALEEQISAVRAHGFGEEVQRRVLAGTSVLSSDRFHSHYEAAAVVRAQLSRSLDKAFRSSPANDEIGGDANGVDLMLVPTALSFPCELTNPVRSNATKVNTIDPTAAFANDVMTIPISLAGLPSLSVPVPVGVVSEENVDGASVDDNVVSNHTGMQIFASRGSEDLLFSVASVLRCDE